jgi:glycosyltransferase involved in cell wall biosynthesis
MVATRHRLQGSLPARGGCQATREAVGCNGNPLVGIVGRLEAWKGQEVFLRAAARISASNRGTVFAVIGGVTPDKDQAYLSRLLTLAKELRLDGRVHFVGHATDVFPWFDALDVCVHATDGEPFGLVLVEAMALGKPLVATALGGPVEIVEEGVSGLLVPPGDDEALAEAICRLLSDTAFAARLAEGGRRRALEFTDERMAAGFAGVLRELVPA